MGRGAGPRAVRARRHVSVCGCILPRALGYMNDVAAEAASRVHDDVTTHDKLQRNSVRSRRSTPRALSLQFAFLRLALLSFESFDTWLSNVCLCRVSVTFMWLLVSLAYGDQVTLTFYLKTARPVTSVLIYNFLEFLVYKSDTGGTKE